LHPTTEALRIIVRLATMLKAAGLARQFLWLNIYVQSVEELQKGIMGKVPAKIDIGPVYSVDPRRRAAYAGALFSFHAPRSPCVLPEPHHIHRPLPLAPAGQPLEFDLHWRGMQVVTNLRLLIACSCLWRGSWSLISTSRITTMCAPVARRGISASSAGPSWPWQSRC
jgi:hypothetical protein